VWNDDLFDELLLTFIFVALVYLALGGSLQGF
jgi:hypothetical protein